MQRLLKSGFDAHRQTDYREDDARRIGDRRGELETFLRLQNVGAGDDRHEQRGDQRYQISARVGMCSMEIDGAGPEDHHRERLIHPREVAPDDVEIDLREDADDCQKRHRQHQTVFARDLIEFKPIGEDQTGSAERGIARGDGASDDASPEPINPTQMS